MPKYIQREAGFTLIELTLVLLISGSVLYIMTQSFDLYMRHMRYSKTIDNAQMSQDALSGYLARTGSYPCPANPNLGPNDALYGVLSISGIIGANLGLIILAVKCQNRYPNKEDEKARRL